MLLVVRGLELMAVLMDSTSAHAIPQSQPYHESGGCYSMR